MFIVSTTCRSYEDFLDRFLEYQDYLSQKILEFEAIRPTHAVVESLENLEIVSSVTNILKTKGKISCSLIRINIPIECGVKTQSFYVYFCAMLELNRSHKTLCAVMPTHDMQIGFKKDYESLLRQEESPHDSIVHVKMGLNIEAYANPLGLEQGLIFLSMGLGEHEAIPKHLHLKMGFYEQDLNLSKMLEKAFFYEIDLPIDPSFQDLKEAIEISKKLALEKKEGDKKRPKTLHSIAVVGEKNFLKPKVVVFEESRFHLEELSPCPSSYHFCNSLESCLNLDDQGPAPASQPNLVCGAEKSATNVQEEEDPRALAMRRAKMNRTKTNRNYLTYTEREATRELEVQLALPEDRRTYAPFSFKTFFVETEFDLLYCVFGRPITTKERKSFEKSTLKAQKEGFLVLFLKHNSKKGFDFSKTEKMLSDTASLTKDEIKTLKNTSRISNTLLNKMGKEKLLQLKIERLSLMNIDEISFFSRVQQWHYSAVEQLLKMNQQLAKKDRSLISTYLTLRFLPFDGNAPLPSGCVLPI